MPTSTPLTRALALACTTADTWPGTLARRLALECGTPARALERLERLALAAGGGGLLPLPGCPGAWLEGVRHLTLPGEASSEARREAVEVAAALGVVPVRGAAWVELNAGRVALAVERA